MLSATDLIVAPATPAGPGARAVVRLAGEGLAATLAALFAAEPPGFAVTGGPRLVSARLSATGLGRDWGPLEVVVLHWPGPGGPVGGPLAEVQLPASVPLVNALVAEACRQGCRIARGGEFTLRAFLAGRLDLVQAEAVLAVVDAATPKQLSVALDRMVVGGGAGLATARDALLDLLADIEAAIDFADETAPDGVPVGPAWPAIAARLAACDAVIDAVAGRLATRDASGTDLPRVVIAGPPNVGKSSLFNTLLGRPAALVADERGTTRDALESTFGDASGARCLLVDLAGLGSDDEPPAGAVAGAAAERARAELVGADVVVACQDALDDAKPVGTPADVVRIDVVTRGDRGAAASGGRRLVTSSRTGAGIEALRAAILDAVAALPPRGTPASARLAVGCCEARRAVAAAAAAAATAVGGGFVDESIVAGHLRRAADALAEVTGATIDGDLIDRIFSRHCVGK